MLNEKASSKSQQRLMGMVYAYKSGKLDLDKLPQSLKDKIKNIADGSRRKTGDKRKKTKGMDIQAAKDFASTKHDELSEVFKFDEFVSEGFAITPGENTNDAQILRMAITAEIDAINLYEQMADSAKDKRIKLILLDVAKEEKTHIAEFETMLLEIDKEQSEEHKNGKKEVEELLKKTK